MPAYCDVCTQPGSLNDDAGYTTNGGWRIEREADGPHYFDALFRGGRQHLRCL